MSWTTKGAVTSVKDQWRSASILLPEVSVVTSPKSSTVGHSSASRQRSLTGLKQIKKRSLVAAVWLPTIPRSNGMNLLGCPLPQIEIETGVLGDWLELVLIPVAPRVLPQAIKVFIVDA